MGAVSLVGNDTLIIKGRTIIDVADGDYFTFSYPNEYVTMKNGKNGNTLYSFSETGRIIEGTLRLIRGSQDDIFFNSELESMKKDFSAYVLLTGEIVKRIGDGQGNVTRDLYTLSGGTIVKGADVSSNAEGDTEQSVSIYTLRFSNAPRSL
jgi:hypothetical protein